MGFPSFNDTCGGGHQLDSRDLVEGFALPPGHFRLPPGSDAKAGLGYEQNEQETSCLRSFRKQHQKALAVGGLEQLLQEPLQELGDVQMVIKKEEGTLSNRHYRTVTGANRITATRDLVQLVEFGLLISHGAGRGAAYRVPLERFLPGSIQDGGGMP
jgi:hypothetical protein